MSEQEQERHETDESTDEPDVEALKFRPSTARGREDLGWRSPKRPRQRPTPAAGTS